MNPYLKAMLFLLSSNMNEPFWACEQKEHVLGTIYLQHETIFSSNTPCFEKRNFPVQNTTISFPVLSTTVTVNTRTWKFVNDKPV